jgi:hypothetical protein
MVVPPSSRWAQAGFLDADLQVKPVVSFREKQQDFRPLSQCKEQGCELMGGQGGRASAPLPWQF